MFEKLNKFEPNMYPKMYIPYETTEQNQTPRKSIKKVITLNQNEYKKFSDDEEYGYQQSNYEIGLPPLNLNNLNSIRTKVEILNHLNSNFSIDSDCKKSSNTNHNQEFNPKEITSRIENKKKQQLNKVNKWSIFPTNNRALVPIPENILTSQTFHYSDNEHTSKITLPPIQNVNIVNKKPKEKLPPISSRKPVNLRSRPIFSASSVMDVRKSSNRIKRKFSCAISTSSVLNFNDEDDLSIASADSFELILDD